MSSIHLLVLVHGMWGNTAHLAELDRIIRQKKGDRELHVLLAQTNAENATYDGIDWGGERVADEVFQEVERLREQGSVVKKFSITGYSLGGLISRYVVGILRQKGFFDDVEPVNFNTIATPHLGLPRYPSFWSTLTSTLGPKLLSRTGEQFYCVDKWARTGKPLLEIMADPDQIFYQGLALFPNICVYANTIGDRTVPYVTAAIEIEDPFVDRETSGIEIEFDEVYAPIVKSFSIPDVPPPPTPKPPVLSKEWLRARKPFLPPVFQLKFPLNIVIYASLPFLMPALLLMIVTRLALASHHSRSRIRLLEKDAPNSHKLIHVLSQLEKDVEDAVADFVDDPGESLDSSSTDVEASASSSQDHGKRKGSSSKTKTPSQQPIITPLQRKIAASLNKLPLKKQLAYIDDVTNSHSVIICRDVKRFDFHRRGEGVVNRWADSFIL